MAEFLSMEHHMVPLMDSCILLHTDSILQSFPPVI